MQNLFSRIVWLIGGVILLLLGFRFILTLLGANATNVIANFVHNTSQPLVAPFFGLFKYDNVTYGVSRFEIYTLIAMLFYIVIAWGIVKLVSLNKR